MVLLYDLVSGLNLVQTVVRLKFRLHLSIVCKGVKQFLARIGPRGRQSRREIRSFAGLVKQAQAGTSLLVGSRSDLRARWHRICIDRPRSAFRLDAAFVIGKA